MKQPAISVILPVYNGEKYLETAIHSILDQTFSEFELLILNDCSTDASRSVIESFKDKRIRAINHVSNQGLIATLNHGIQLSTGRLIARMDQDDISDPERLQKQYAFLTNSKTCAVVGTLAAVIDNDGNFSEVMPVPIYPSDIRFGMYNKNCFCHGSVCIDRSKIPPELLQYPTADLHAEDYSFWLKLVQNNIEMYNIPEVLYFWRSHNLSISKTQNVAQLETFRKLQQRYQSHRLQFGFADLLHFYRSATSQLPATVTVLGNKEPSNLKRDYQYLLYAWATRVWKNKPLQSLFALVLMTVIAPATIFQQTLNRTLNE